MADPWTVATQRRKELLPDNAPGWIDWIVDPIGMAKENAGKTKPRAKPQMDRDWNQTEKDALAYLKMVREGKVLEADRQFANLAEIKNLIADRGWATEDEMVKAYQEANEPVQPGETGLPSVVDRPARAPAEAEAEAPTTSGLFDEEAAPVQEDTGPDYDMDENGRGGAETVLAYQPAKDRTMQKELVPYQQRLIDGGYLEATDKKGESNADGYYGDLTRAAVKSFQRENGLPETGTIDRRTADALLQRQERW